MEGCYRVLRFLSGEFLEVWMRLAEGLIEAGRRRKNSRCQTRDGKDTRTVECASASDVGFGLMFVPVSSYIFGVNALSISDSRRRPPSCNCNRVVSLSSGVFDFHPLVQIVFTHLTLNETKIFSPCNVVEK